MVGCGSGLDVVDVVWRRRWTLVAVDCGGSRLWWRKIVKGWVV